MKRTLYKSRIYIRTRRHRMAALMLAFSAIFWPFMLHQSGLNASVRLRGGGNNNDATVMYFNGKDWVDARLVKSKDDTTQGSKKLFYFNGIVWIDAGMNESSLGGTHVPEVDLSKPDPIADIKRNTTADEHELEASSDPSYKGASRVIDDKIEVKQLDVNANAIKLPANNKIKIDQLKDNNLGTVKAPKPSVDPVADKVNATSTGVTVINTKNINVGNTKAFLVKNNAVIAPKKDAVVVMPVTAMDKSNKVIANPDIVPNAKVDANKNDAKIVAKKPEVKAVAKTSKTEVVAKEDPKGEIVPDTKVDAKTTEVVAPKKATTKAPTTTNKPEKVVATNPSPKAPVAADTKNDLKKEVVVAPKKEVTKPTASVAKSDANINTKTENETKVANTTTTKKEIVNTNKSVNANALDDVIPYANLIARPESKNASIGTVAASPFGGGFKAPKEPKAPKAPKAPDVSALAPPKQGDAANATGQVGDTSKKGSPFETFLTTPYDTAAEMAAQDPEAAKKAAKKKDKKGAEAPASTDALKAYIDQQVQSAMQQSAAAAPAAPAAPAAQPMPDTSQLAAAKQKLEKELAEKEKRNKELDAKLDQQQQQIKAARLGAQPGLMDTVKLDDGRLQVRQEQIALSKKVFGWAPYWIGDAYKSYDFGLLSTVAYFSYEVDPSTGSYKSIHDWNTTDLIDLAQAKKCKVVLTATLMKERDLSQFLANKAAQQTFIDSIRSLVVLRNGDGVNINFENLSNRYRDEFADFILRLSHAFKSINPNYQISVTLPAVDIEDAYDAAAMDAGVDLYIMMGYDFSGSYSVQAGATSPLGAFSGNSLPACVDAWLSKKIAPDKLLLGLPYYGVLWQVDGDQAPARVVKFIKDLSYSQIKERYAGQEPDFYEASMTPYYHGPSATAPGFFEQCWFDNPRSMNLKYDMVNEKKLGGIGVWALGMDGADKGLWGLIEEKFVKLEKVPVDTLPIKPVVVASSQSSIGRWFKRKMNRLYGILRRPSTFNPKNSGLDNFLKAFMILGGLTFLITRFAFIYRRLQMGDKWKDKNYFVYLMLFGIALFTVSLLFYAYLTQFFQKIYHSKSFLFVIGIILGIVVCLVFVLYFIPKILRNKDLP